MLARQMKACFNSFTPAKSRKTKVKRPKSEVLLKNMSEHVAYDHETGALTWVKPSSTCTAVGSIAGTVNSAGYVVVVFRGVKILGHRAAWFLHTGAIASGVIDHINGVRSDNRIANLRDVSIAINSQNQRAARARSKSGLLGAFPNKKGWKSEIRTGESNLYLGTFKTPEEAHGAYVEAKRRLHAGNTL